MHYMQLNSVNPDFIQLCQELDQFLNEIVGGEENRAEYIPLNQLSDLDNIVVAYEKDCPVGCAGIKRYDTGHAEVKRVFVRPQYRKKGIGKKLMELLEEMAKEKGYQYLILESGDPLKEAMQLYKNMGYKISANYGPYQDMKESICMKKKL